MAYCIVPELEFSSCSGCWYVYIPRQMLLIAHSITPDDSVFENILNQQPSPPDQITDNLRRSNSLEGVSSIECEDERDITGSSQRPTVGSTSNPEPGLETIFPDSFPHNQMVQSDFPSASFEPLQTIPSTLSLLYRLCIRPSPKHYTQVMFPHGRYSRRGNNHESLHGSNE
jgi:hypothetical protein